MQRQHETMQIGAIAPDNPEIEFGDDPLALRRFPTLAPIERHLRAQVQVLNHDVLVALVARASRRQRPYNDRRPDRQLVQLAAAAAVRRRAPAALVVAAAVRCLVHAGWLLRRTRRQLLQPCKLVLDRLMLSLQLRQGVAELLILRTQTPNLANQIANHADQVRRRQPFQRIRDGRCHPKLESYFCALDSPSARKFAPGTTGSLYALDLMPQKRGISFCQNCLRLGACRYLVTYSPSDLLILQTRSPLAPRPRQRAVGRRAR